MSIFDKLPTLKQDKNNKFLIKLVELLKLLENKINSTGGDVTEEIDQINNQIITINNSITNINHALDEIDKDVFDIKNIYKTFILTVEENAPQLNYVFDLQSLYNSNFYNYKFTFNRAINWDLILILRYGNNEIRYTINGLNNTFNTDNYINVDINYFNSLIEKTTLTSNELNEVKAIIERSNEIIAELIEDEIDRLDSLLERF